MLKVYKGLVLSFLIFGFHFLSFGSISQSANPPMVGCPDTFTTTLAGTIYQWDFGPYSLAPFASDTNTPSAIAFFYAPGTYKIYVNVINGGNSQLDSLSITVQPNSGNINLFSTADTICAGSQITFTANPSSFIRYDFLINDSLVASTTADNYTTTSLAQGDSVQVMGFNGTCFTNLSPALHPVVFPKPLAATLTSSTDTICGGDTVILTATPGYDTYTFYNGGSEEQSNVSNLWITSQLGAGNTVSVVVSKNGCYSSPSNIESIYVKNTPFVTTVIASPTVCAGDTVTITANPPGLDNYNFFINSSSVQNTGVNTYTSSTLVTNDTIVARGKLLGCSSHLSYPIIMTVNQVPNVTLTATAANDSTCQGVPVTFTASPSGYATYEFFDTTSLLQSTSSNTYTTSSLANGNSISVTAVNLGCTSPASDTISIYVTASPVVTVGADQIACLNSPPDTLSGFTPVGGTWLGTGITDPSGIFNPAVANTGTHLLIYLYIDPASGCPGDDSMNYTVNPIPIISLTPTINICQNQSAQINAISNGVSFAWSPATDLSNPNIANPVATPAQTTDYTLTVTGGNNCTDTASVNVIVNPNPVAGFTVSNVCANAPAVFTNTSTPATGNNYLWAFGDGALSVDSNPTHTYTTPDSFDVILIAQLGFCFDTTAQPLVVLPSAVADFAVFPLYGYNDKNSPISFVDHSLNAAGWLWDFGDQTSSIIESPSHVYTQTGVYTITLIANNPDGCNDTAIKTNYLTIYQTPQVYIPNVFAPTANDVDNSILLVRAKGVKVFEWEIYNRIGEKVFQSEDPNIGWDGTYKMGKSPEGVYAYYLRIVFEDESVRYYRGSVTLLR